MPIVDMEPMPVQMEESMAPYARKKQHFLIATTVATVLVVVLCIVLFASVSQEPNLERHPASTHLDYSGPAGARYSANLLSACYGYAGCVGVPSATDYEDLIDRGCTVIQTADDGTTSTATEYDSGTDDAGQYSTNVAAANGVPLLCGTGFLSDYPTNNDGMPITFNWPVKDSPATITASSIEITLNNGTVVNPYCATARPANEGNECQTYLLIGTFGDGRGLSVWPVKVEIVGDDIKLQPGVDGAPSVNAKGVVFESDILYSNGLYMVQANLQEFSTNGETTLGGSYPNHCGVIFGSRKNVFSSYTGVTHRIQIVIAGGSSKDGVTGLTGDETNFFEILLSDGSSLNNSSVYLGIADLGGSVDDTTTDGDNFYDLCLNDADGEYVDRIASVHMPCSTSGGTCLYPPKGTYGKCCTEKTLAVQISNY